MMRFLALALCAGPVFAAPIVSINQPNSAYTSGTVLVPITDPEGSIINSLSDGFLTITFSSGGLPEPMDVNAVGSSWGSWGSPPFTEGSTPPVLHSDDSFFDIVYQFNVPLMKFGFELEPNDTAMPHAITATFLLGSTPAGSITRTVSGNGGALLFAGSGGPFDRVEVTSDNDFAAAQFRYAAVTIAPEPPTTLPLFGGLFALLLTFRSRIRKSAGPSLLPGSPRIETCKRRSRPRIANDR